MKTDKIKIIKITEKLNGYKIWQVISNQLGISRRATKKLLDSLCVTVNNFPVWISSYEVIKGDLIKILLPEKNCIDKNCILYEDSYLMIINKPSRWLSIGPGSIEEFLRKKYTAIKAVHRLDRFTTGCLIFAKDNKTFDQMLELFRSSGVKKIYHAITAGIPSKPEMTILKPIDGLPTYTALKVIKATDSFAYISVMIKTGRTHQIRKHLAYIRCPILGDYKYGNIKHQINVFARIMPNLMLHAKSLQFIHPVTKSAVTVSSPLPDYFKETLNVLHLI